MSNPVCSATRSTILTGRYGFRTGVGNIVGSLSGSNELDTAEVTIPRILKYSNSFISSANIGKWHLQNPAPPAHLLYPNKMGYDHFEGPFIGQLTSYTNWTKVKNGVSSTCTNYATSENVDNAVAWLKSLNSAHPFFIWLAFNAPHEPLQLPPSNLHTYTSLTGTVADINAHPKSYFKAMTQALDTEIGRLFDSLKAINKYDSTDFIFIGDNGNTQKTAQIANIDRAKGTVYQYGVHVPLIIAGPDVKNSGRTNDELINSTDLFATILELMRANNWKNYIPSSKPIDAKSIMPIINNNIGAIRPWSFCEIFKITTDSADGKGIRNQDYKLIRFDYGKQEFYNLSIDANENNDLLKQTITATDIINYNYLCAELNQLLNTGSFCQLLNSAETPTNAAKNSSYFPNPFTSFISSENNSTEFVQLINTFTQVIYEGNEIEKQDFSFLPKGIYFLKCNKENKVIKMMKE
jgi:arylsulfatase A-like enzyme